MIDQNALDRRQAAACERDRVAAGAVERTAVRVGLVADPEVFLRGVAEDPEERARSPREVVAGEELTAAEDLPGGAHTLGALENLLHPGAHARERRPL